MCAVEQEVAYGSEADAVRSTNVWGLSRSLKKVNKKYFMFRVQQASWST